MEEKAAIIGTLNVEIFLTGLTGLPDWGRQGFIKNSIVSGAGSGPRVAFPLAMLGVKSFLIGKIGDDTFGREVGQAIKGFGLTTSGIEKDKRLATGFCVCLSKSEGDRMILSFLGSVAETDEEVVLRHLKKTDFLLVTGYCSLPGLTKDGLKRIFLKARRNGIVTLLDPGWDPGNWREKRKEILSLLPLVDVFLPNLDEAKALTRKKEHLNMAKSLQKSGAKAVIIKMGKKGSLGLKGGEVVYEPALKISALNTTAAGEAFNAGILYGLIKRWDLKKSLIFANILSGLFVSSRTGEYPALSQINKIMRCEGTVPDLRSEARRIGTVPENGGNIC